jgi:hypothetical protein
MERKTRGEHKLTLWNRTFVPFTIIGGGFTDRNMEKDLWKLENGTKRQFFSVTWWFFSNHMTENGCLELALSSGLAGC